MIRWYVILSGLNKLLSLIRRGESEILTHGDTVMHVGDVLIILTDENSLKVKKEIYQKLYRMI